MSETLKYWRQPLIKKRRDKIVLCTLSIIRTMSYFVLFSEMVFKEVGLVQMIQIQIVGKNYKFIVRNSFRSLKT